MGGGDSHRVEKLAKNRTLFVRRLSVFWCSQKEERRARIKKIEGNEWAGPPTGTGVAHLFDKGVHLGPVVAKAQLMEGMICVQMPANGI